MGGMTVITMIKKNIIIIAIILILTGIVLVAAVFYAVKNLKIQVALPIVQPDAGGQQNFLQDEKEQCAGTAAPAECEKLTYGVWAQQRSAEILAAGDYQRCPELGVGFRVADCWSQLAYSLNDKEICEQITDENFRKNCLDSLIPLSGNFSDCQQLAAESQKDYCYKKIVGEMASVDDCNSLPAGDRNLCGEIFITQRAVQESDYDLCKTIPTSAGQQNCLNLLPKDSDGDKLSDYAEKHFFGTDPGNPDTDGDGHLDGDEVRAGYNPNGPGRL